MSKKNKNKQVYQQVEEPVSTPLVEEESVAVEQPIEEVEETTAEPQETVAEAIVPNDDEVTAEKPVVAEEAVAEEESSEEPETEVEEKEPELPPVVEKKEEEKVNKTKGVLIVEKKTIPAAGEAVVPKSVEKFYELADKYIDIMSKESIADEDRRKGVYTLTALCKYVLSSSDTKVFDACFSFFLKNRAIMLVPDRVTDGLYKFGDKAKVTQIVQWYVTFQSLVESKLLKTRFSLNVTTIRRVFGNDALTNWLIIKKK